MDIDLGGIVVIFAKKQGKKLFPEEMIKKKEKTWVWVKNTK